MDIDRSATRRNLMITSIGFIVYAFGKGQIKPDASFPIGFTLNDPSVLMYGAWIALFWFAFRYRLDTGGVWRDCVNHFYVQLTSNRAELNRLCKEIECRGDLQSIDSTGVATIHVAQVSSSGRGRSFFIWKVKLGGTAKVEPNQQSHGVAIKDGEIDLPRFSLFIFKLRVVLQYFWEIDLFSKTVVPLIMFWLAVFCGLTRYFQPDLNPFEFIAWTITTFITFMITFLSF